MLLFMLYNDRYSPYYDKTLRDDQTKSGRNSGEPVFVGGGGDRMSRVHVWPSRLIAEGRGD